MTVDTAISQRDVAVGRQRLAGMLSRPAQAGGLVLFAHGSGSSRFSSRNQFVAAELQQRGLATLLFDLLTPTEEVDRDNVFDIGLLAERMVDAAQWTLQQTDTRSLAIGLFGASTGAAAALAAAAMLPDVVSAVVSRGGRPDLARGYLADVEAPTLLIVGERDEAVIELSRLALRELNCEKQLVIVPRATHLFEEPGTLAAVARLAGDWFLRHLARSKDDVSAIPQS